MSAIGPYWGCDYGAIDFTARHWCDGSEPNEFIRGPLRIAWSREVSQMTVGIAVMCDEGKSVVIVADRLVTLQLTGMIIQVDTDCAKMTQLNSDVIAAFSGTNANGHGVYSKLSGISTAVSISDIASKFKSACREHRDRLANERLGKVGSSLEALGAAAIGQRMPSALSEQIKGMTVGGSFLIAGVDNTGAHVFLVDDDLLAPQDDPGFAAIGSGSITAYPILASARIHKGISLEEALYRAYEAKRVAEADYGVGRNTQIAVSRSGTGVQFLTQSVIDELAKTYDRRSHLEDFENAANARAIKDQSQQA
jgi:20S proteasome alpha/beta subunit